MNIRLLIATSLLLAGCSPSGSEPAPEALVGGENPSDEQALMTPPPGELTGEQLWLACSSCHSIRPGEAHKVGPNLNGIIGQPAGSREGFAYSPALLAAGSERALTWQSATLMAWILQTEAMVPGTWMLYDNSLGVSEVRRLVGYILKEASAESD